MIKIKQVLALSLSLFSLCSFSQVINLHFNVTEYKEGSGGNYFSALITLSSPSDKEISVSYKTLDGTAIAGEDYDAVSGKALFAPGETMVSVDIWLVADDIAEEYRKKFIFLLTDPVNAQLANEVQALTILDDDIELTFSKAPQIKEGKLGERTKAIFTVSSKYSFGEDVLVGIQTLDGQGSATAGVDYEIDYATVVLSGENHKKTFEVTVLGDEEIEINETFAVQIWSSDERVSIANNTQYGTIIDDDGDLYFKYDINVKTFTSSKREFVAEGNTSGEIQLKQTQLDNGDIVFEGENTPLIHTSSLRGIGQLVTIPGASTLRLYSTDGRYSANSMVAKWTISPYPLCKIPMVGFKNCTWYAVTVEGQRSDYSADPGANGGFFTIKDWAEANNAGNDGVVVVKKEIKKTFSLGVNDINELTVTYQIVRKEKT